MNKSKLSLALSFSIVAFTMVACNSGGSAPTSSANPKPQEITSKMFFEKLDKTTGKYLFDDNYQGIGKLEDAWDEKDSKGKVVHMKTFHGIVYRGDSRDLSSICKLGGFKSRNDLNNKKYLAEAYGIGIDANGNIAAGATGQSGVSTAKIFMNSVMYSTSGKDKGYTYVIDSENLLSFDMPTISMQYKGRDETGLEVNIFDIPCEKIIGYYSIQNTYVDNPASFKDKTTQTQIKSTFTINPQYKVNKDLYNLMK